MNNEIIETRNVINASDKYLNINGITTEARSSAIFKLLDTNRLEVIDANGRSYVNRHKNNNIELSFQDNGKTLKVFVSGKQGYSNE